MRNILVALAVVLLLSMSVCVIVALGDAGINTETLDRNDTVHVNTITWQSTAGGVVTATTSRINGQVLRVVIDPDNLGSEPTDNYDVTLDDLDGVDVLSGLGANLDSNTTYSICGGQTIVGSSTTNVWPFAVSGSLIFEVANAGNSNSGITRIYWRP